MQPASQECAELSPTFAKQADAITQDHSQLCHDEAREINTQIDQLLKIPRRGVHQASFEDDIKNKQAKIAEIEEQVEDAKARGKLDEVKRLKNKISAYKSRMKVRARLERHENKTSQVA